MVSIIKPNIVSLLTTFKCTATCNNCCFQCNPKCTKKMSFAEMKQYLDKCIHTYPNIKVLVFTGGECTLLWEDLIKMISYASSIGIKTRIVTNGWWAKSYKIAVNKINELVKAGLKEINFSTGDDHQQWVPFKQVRNAAVASIRHHLICAINVETKDNSFFNIDNIISKDKVFKSLISCTDKVDTHHIYIERGIWASFNNKKDLITYKQYENSFSYKRCKHLFSTIAINPYGEVLACCGITSERNPYMRLGNINKEDIRKIYERSFDDILKLWLYVDGPEKIELYINKHKKKGKKTIFMHSCVTCKNIFCNLENLLFLREHVDDYFTKVILKYNILNFK